MFQVWGASSCRRISGGANVPFSSERAGSPLAQEFMRFPKEDGRLAHWLDYSRDRMPPPMRRLIDSAFSLDPSGHRVRSAIQPLIQRQSYSWCASAATKSVVSVLAGAADHADRRVPRLSRGLERGAHRRRGDCPHRADPRRRPLSTHLRCESRPAGVGRVAIARSAHRLRVGEVSSWLLSALHGLASARRQHRSDRTFGRVWTAVSRRADLRWGRFDRPVVTLAV
jgi:hypothetical protein